MKLLVENGASINIYDGGGGTPFQNAVLENHVEMVTYLIENGADLKLRTKNFRNNSIELALKDNIINILKKLIYH